MLFGPAEAFRSVGAVVSIARGDASAVAEFDQSFHGFWRSFGSVLIGLPFAILFTYAERQMWPIVKPGFPVPAALPHYIAEIIAFFVYWEAIPLAMISITRQLKLTERFVPFVIVWNWSNVVTALMLTPPIVLFLFGGSTTESTLVVGAASTLLTVAFQARIAQVTLGVNLVVAIGISLLNLSFGLILAGIADYAPLFFTPS